MKTDTDLDTESEFHRKSHLMRIDKIRISENLFQWILSKRDSIWLESCSLFVMIDTFDVKWMYTFSPCLEIWICSLFELYFYSFFLFLFQLYIYFFYSLNENKWKQYIYISILYLTNEVIYRKKTRILFYFSFFKKLIYTKYFLDKIII